MLVLLLLEFSDHLAVLAGDLGELGLSYIFLKHVYVLFGLAHPYLVNLIQEKVDALYVILVKRLIKLKELNLLILWGDKRLFIEEKWLVDVIRFDV